MHIYISAPDIHAGWLPTHRTHCLWVVRVCAVVPLLWLALALIVHPAIFSFGAVISFGGGCSDGSSLTDLCLCLCRWLTSLCLWLASLAGGLRHRSSNIRLRTQKRSSWA